MPSYLLRHNSKILTSSSRKFKMRRFKIVITNNGNIKKTFIKIIDIIDILKILITKILISNRNNVINQKTSLRIFKTRMSTNM